MSILTASTIPDLVDHTNKLLCIKDLDQDSLAILRALDGLVSKYAPLASSNQLNELQKLDNDSEKQDTAFESKLDNSTWELMTAIVQKSKNEDIDEHIETLVLTYATLLAIIRVSSHLMNTSLDTLDEINYYDASLARSRFIGLYAIQTLPRNTVSLVRHLTSRVSDTSRWRELKANAFTVETAKAASVQVTVAKFLDLSAQLYQLTKATLRDMIRKWDAPTASFIQSSNSVFGFVRAATGLPFANAKLELQAKRQEISKLQKQNVQLLGWLLNNVPQLQVNGVLNEGYNSMNLNAFSINFDFSIVGKLKQMLAHRKIPQPSDLNTDNIHQQLYDLYNIDIPNFELCSSQLLDDSSRPGYFTRNWPILLPAIVFLPQTIKYIYNNQANIMDYIKSTIASAKDTFIGLCQNWIFEPLNNVLRTIRHDPDSRLALMSEQSLESDLGSLERMVVEYVVDNRIPVTLPNGDSAIISSLDPVQQDQVLQTIKSGVQHGNLTLLLTDYENSLPHPIKELLLGQMLRNVLIQIQKTKVDGSIALAGIDKIVRSQELVFGCIAASPALLGLWFTVSWGVGWFFGKNSHTFQTPKQVGDRLRVRRGLARVSRLAAKLLETPTTDNGDYEKGLMFIEIIHLQRLGKKVIPSLLYGEWSRDLNGLLSGPPDMSLAVLDRLWNVSSVYL